MGYLKLKYVEKYNSAILKMGEKLLKKRLKKIEKYFGYEKKCVYLQRKIERRSIKFYLLNKNVLYDKKI